MLVVVAAEQGYRQVCGVKKFGDHQAGYTMTVAPTIVKDQKTGKVMLIHGSLRARIWRSRQASFAVDPETGKEIWMRPLR